MVQNVRKNVRLEEHAKGRKIRAAIVSLSPPSLPLRWSSSSHKQRRRRRSQRRISGRRSTDATVDVVFIFLMETPTYVTLLRTRRRRRRREEDQQRPCHSVSQSVPPPPSLPFPTLSPLPPFLPPMSVRCARSLTVPITTTTRAPARGGKCV